MQDFEVRQIVTEDTVKELELVGFDEGYKFVAADKFKYKTFKIYDLTLAQANILKQIAISFGADCGVNRDIVTGNVEKTDAILGGSFSQIKKISEQLKKQPFNLGKLADTLTQKLCTPKRETKLTGILNITPDSFSDGGLYANPNDAIHHFETLIKDGADMIDIGAESTRPNNTEVSSAEQIKRLKPIMEYIRHENIKIPLSVDTRSSEVADFVLNYGINYINDVSGTEYDHKILDVVSKYKAGLVIQHSGKTENTTEEVYKFLKTKTELAKSYGIENIIIDVGIGFGKTKEQNFELLERIEEFHSLELPIMIGVSRKSLLGLQNSNDNSLKDSLTLALSYPLINKVDYLRVHNIKLHHQLLNMIR